MDPDLEAVGMVIKGSRLYMFGALWLISTSISMVFIKVGGHAPCTYTWALCSDSDCRYGQ